MTRDEHRRLTDALLPAVIAAARLELDYFEAGCPIASKSDRSPVTQADTEAEAILLRTLSRLFPELTTISEEAFAGGHRPAPTDPFLLVDPLDGTKQFIAGAKEFTINIAIVDRGRPVYGLIFAPALDDLLVTDGPGRSLRARVAPRSVDPGAALSIAAFDPVGIVVRNDSDRAAAGGLVSVQSRSRNLDVSNEFLSGFRIAERRWLGSSYKFCLIAAGEADIYPQLGDTYEWDTAAGEAILTAAGGSVVALDGAPLEYGRSSADYLNPTFVASAAPLEDLRTADGA